MKPPRSASAKAENQQPVDYFDAERLIRSGTRLTDGQFADLLERNPDTPLPSIVRAHLIGLLRGKATLPRGRKQTSIAAWDFLLADAAELYRKQLKALQDASKRKRAEARRAGVKLPRGGPSASAQAAEFVRENESRFGQYQLPPFPESHVQVRKPRVPGRASRTAG